MKAELYTDGGSRGNPGPAAAGIIIKIAEKTYSYGYYLGKKTNNQAEYAALYLGLQHLLQIIKEYSVDTVGVYMDSELIIKQLKGEYRVRDENLKQVFGLIQKLIREMPVVQFNHILREYNQLADRVVNNTLDIENGYKKATTTTTN